MLVATPLYVAMCAVLLTFLGLRVVKGRRQHRILIGDNGNRDFIWIVRAHGNFTETAPLTLIAIASAELAGAPGFLVHACGLSLVIGRLLHAYCFLKAPHVIRLRQWGMYLTLASLWVAAAAAVYRVAFPGT